MKSCWIRTGDGGTAFEFCDVPMPRPGPGEILLRVHASSLNRIDLNAHHRIDGMAVGGGEAAGEVHEVGEGVVALRTGDRVMGRSKGGFAEYVLMDARQAIAVPDRLTWGQAAAIPLVFLVTHEMLCTYGKLEQDEWLLVTGASSGVGVACIQVGKLLGAKVIGTSGSAEKLARLKAIGLDVGIVTRGADFASQVRAATGGAGANLAINNVGGSLFAECVRALGHRGRLAIIGSVDGVRTSEIDLETVHSNRLEIFGLSNKNTSGDERAQIVQAFVRDLLPAFADGRVAPVIDHVYAFAELTDARRHMEANAHIGKIVIRMR